LGETAEGDGVKKTGIPIGKGFKISKDGKVDPDYAQQEASLDLCKRIARRKSKKVRVSRVPRQK
jgi:hypothetical protein